MTRRSSLRPGPTAAHRTLVGLAFAGLALLGSASASQAQGRGGFFRDHRAPEVYWQFSPNFHCHVQNPAQMNAYGGFGQINVMPNPPLRGRFAGPCPWPDGFWRRADRPEVYLIRRGSICHVVNERQMAMFGGFRLVRVVPPDSRVTVGLNPVVPCRDP